MPVRKVCSKKKKKCYYQFGNRGKKYYFKQQSQAARKHAKLKAIKQGVAINYSRRRRGKKPYHI